MAVSGAVRLEVIAKAQENITAVLKQSNAAIRKTANELKGAELQQGKMGRTIDLVKGKALAFKASLIALGAAAAYAAAQQLADFTKEGARMADQVDAVRGRVSNLDEVIQQTQDATTGIVDEAAIVKGVSLFDAFGLEIAQLPALFAEASKTSLRTGESLDTLISSAVTGIARMSPPILDNLGLQVRLADATSAAAEKFGVEADALDETQKKAGMLSIVLDRLGEQNKDIHLNDSRTASIQRLEVQFKDSMDGIAKSFADMFKTTGERMEEFSKTTDRAVLDASRRWEDLTRAVEEETRKQAETLHEAEGDQLRASSMQQFFVEKSIALEEHKTQALARIRKAEGAAESEALRSRTVATMTETGMKIWDAERYEAIQERHATAAKERNDEESRAIAARFAARRDELLSMDAVSEVAIETEREEMARLSGVTEAQLALTAAKKAYARISKEGSDEERKVAHKAQLEAQRAVNMEKKRSSTRKTSVKVVKDETSSILEKIEALEAEARIAKFTDALDIARAKRTERENAVLKEAAQIKDADLQRRFKAAALDASEREFLLDKKEITDAERDASTQLAAARAALDIARATNEEDKIRIQLATDIAAVRADTEIPTAEALLTIKLLEIEAEKDLGRVRRENFEEAAAAVGEVSGAAFGDAADHFNKMDDALDKLGHPKRFEQVASGFRALSAQSNQIAKSVSDFSSAVGKSNEDIARGSAAAIGAVGPVVAAFAKTIAEKAAIQMAFELAMGTALMFVPGAQAEAAAHFAAAAMFGVIAGVSAAQPTTTAPDETSGAGLITPAAEARETEREAQSFTINLGPGTIFGLPQTMGREIADRISSMSGSGFEESTAF